MTRVRPPWQIAVLAALVLCSVGVAAPAFADDRVQITKLAQDLADALVPGDVTVWDRTLDSGVIVAEEDGSFKGKPEMLKEIEPMPKGLGGNIVIELLAVQLIAERTEPASITVPAETLQQYAGVYQLRNSEPKLTLSVVDGKLMGARTGRKPAEWLAETPDVFFIPGDLRIRKIFQRDGAGKVNRLTERRESWDIVWDNQLDRRALRSRFRSASRAAAAARRPADEVAGRDS